MNIIKIKVLSQFGWDSFIVEGERVSQDDVVMHLSRKDEGHISFGGCQVEELVQSLNKIMDELG